MLAFTKMNGAGNDFVLFDNRDGAIRLSPAVIEKICDRHRGIGADGVLLLEKPSNGHASFRMRYYNSDGGEAEMCGNGARCFARFANRIAGPVDEVLFETMAGVIRASFTGDSVRLIMSAPRNLLLNRALGDLQVHSVDTGVPHAVVFVDDVEQVDVPRLGAHIRRHALFAPAGTNVNFIQQEGPQSVAVRTFERGVEAETLACGTGVVASALIFHKVTGAASPIRVRVRGGDSLEVGFEERDGAFENVTLTGPADFVFDGSIDEPAG